jgi:hypothetical protein
LNIICKESGKAIYNFSVLFCSIRTWLAIRIHVFADIKSFCISEIETKADERIVCRINFQAKKPTGNCREQMHFPCPISTPLGIVKMLEEEIKGGGTVRNS